MAPGCCAALLACALSSRAVGMSVPLLERKGSALLCVPRVVTCVNGGDADSLAPDSVSCASCVSCVSCVPSSACLTDSHVLQERMQARSHARMAVVMGKKVSECVCAVVYEERKREDRGDGETTWKAEKHRNALPQNAKRHRVGCCRPRKWRNCARKPRSMSPAAPTACPAANVVRRAAARWCVAWWSCGALAASICW